TESGFGGPEITQHPVLIITQGEQRFRRVRLQFLRILQRTLRGIAPSASSSVSPGKVDKRVRARKPRPSHRKIRVKLHRPLIKTGGFPFEIGRIETGEATCFES